MMILYIFVCVYVCVCSVFYTTVPSTKFSFDYESKVRWILNKSITYSQTKTQTHRYWFSE